MGMNLLLDFGFLRRSTSSVPGVVQFIHCRHGDETRSLRGSHAGFQIIDVIAGPAADRHFFLLLKHMEMCT
jgi:hypothetical protein